MVAGILAAHVAAGWGLLQVSAVREALLQAAPMFVEPHHAAGTARAARNATAAAATGRQALAFA